MNDFAQLDSSLLDTVCGALNMHGSDPATLYISKETYKDIKRAVAVGQQYDQEKRLKRRQRRAHQRKHNRGEV